MSCHDVKSFNYGEQRFVHGEPRLPWLGLLGQMGLLSKYLNNPGKGKSSGLDVLNGCGGEYRSNQVAGGL
jgi:hypothetical protein